MGGSLIRGVPGQLPSARGDDGGARRRVDHATLNRWVVKYVPLLEREFRTRKLPVGSGWRMDESYVRVKGSWKYLYRAVDKAGANTAAIERYDVGTGAGIEIRQIKYLNNIVEQDHRAITRLIRPMPGFRSFRSAAVMLAGIELIHMIRKGQLPPAGVPRGSSSR